MAAKSRDVWLRYKGKGKSRRPDSWYYGSKLRLRTKDAVQARERARLAQEGKWPPPSDEKAGDVTAAAFAIADPPPAAPPPKPEPAPAPAAIPVTGDWIHAASAAGAETMPPPELPTPEPEVSSEQLAEMLVTLELTILEGYTRSKFYEGFAPPPMPDSGRALLVSSYRSILDYGGAALALPPWLDKLIKGVVFPGIALVASSKAIAEGYRDEALKQKRQAEGGA